MSTSLEEALRDALEQVSDAPPPPGLAPAAIRMARRRRAATMTAGIAAAAMVVVAAPVALWAVSPAGTGEPPPGTGAVAPGADERVEPLTITAYSGWRSVILDRAAGEYVEVPYESLVPSPDGTRALVYTGDNSPDNPLRVGVMEPVPGEVRWIEDLTGTGNVSTGGWSPDGREILIAETARLGRHGFAIVDAETLEYDFVAHPDITTPGVNTMGLRYVWSPDGKEIVLTESTWSDSEALPDQVTGIRFYDRSGALLRTVPASAALTAETSFSPDGAWMALHHRGQETVQVADPATGEVAHTVPVPALSQVVGWADPEHLLVLDDSEAVDSAEGTESGQAQQLLVLDLSGEIHTTLGLPEDVGWIQQVHVGGADGLPSGASPLMVQAN